MGIVFLIFLFYIWASLPCLYTVSFFFEVPSTALVRVTIFNVVSGLATLIAVTVLNLLGKCRFRLCFYR